MSAAVIALVAVAAVPMATSAGVQSHSLARARPSAGSGVARSPQGLRTTPPVRLPGRSRSVSRTHRSRTTATSRHGRLPVTGGEPLLIAALGAALLGVGLGVRVGAARDER